MQIVFDFRAFNPNFTLQTKVMKIKQLLAGIMPILDGDARKKQTAKAVLKGPIEHRGVLNVHRHDPNNVGDFYCAPHLYFPELHQKVLDIGEMRKASTKVRFNWAQSVRTHDLIIGGGGLLNLPHFAQQMALFEALGSRGKKTVLWGPGHNDPAWSTFKTPAQYQVDLSKFGMVGLRDYSAPGTWVPCVSCLHPIFDQKIAPEHEYGVLMGKKSAQNQELQVLLRDVPSSHNATDLPIDGFMGMAQHPITEEVFVLFKDNSGDRYIGRLNTATGEIITEGQTQTSLNSIAFDASGVLYAMQGFDSGDGVTMQTVDIYTAPETAFHTFTNTNGGDMDAITFNTTENLMYRFDAGSDGGEFLSLNLETLEETVIADWTFDFDTWGGGLAYRQGQNKFLLGTGQTLYNLLADGTISELSTIDITGNIKGLLNAPNSGEFWVVTNDGSDIYTVNISDGSIISSVSASALNLAANPINGFMGMAQHPITEEVFVLFKDNSGDRYIGRLNTATGEIITEGQTQTSLNSIAFDASGVLYAMQGFDSGDGVTMQTVDIYTAPETAFHTFTNTNGGDMDAIAFNTTENLMYRFDGDSSDGELLSLNLETLEETVIADLSFDFDTWGGGLAYRQGQNKFLLGTGQTLYNLLADGTISTISTVDIRTVEEKQ